MTTTTAARIARLQPNLDEKLKRPCICIPPPYAENTFTSLSIPIGQGPEMSSRAVLYMLLRASETAKSIESITESWAKRALGWGLREPSSPTLGNITHPGTNVEHYRAVF